MFTPQNFDWTDVKGATKCEINLDPAPEIIVDSSDYKTTALDLLYGADSRIVYWFVYAGDDYGRWSSISETGSFLLVRWCPN